MIASRPEPERSDLRILRMQHGGDGLVEHIVVPDAPPVLAQHKAIANADGDLAGVGNLEDTKIFL